MDVREHGRTGPRLTASSPLSRLILILSTLLLLGSGWAQVCEDELRSSVLPDAPASRVATALARTAVESIEPALPNRSRASRAWNDPNANWLDRHGFLPHGWSEDDPPTPALWAELLANLQRPYRVAPRPLSGRTDPQTLLNETQAALQRVASSVRPLALVATRPGERNEVASVSVIWNWTPWPRLLIFEPHDLLIDTEDEIGGVLLGVGTCAWRPRAYFRTDVNTATNYYFGNAQAQVRLLATNLGHSWELVPDDQERTMFAFEGHLLRGATVAAIGFEGPGPSTWQVMKFLTTAQTNVGAFDLPYYLALP
jgi:hypothetical protein